jgi:dihydroorotate dehydrogenase (NAD+) catalytic subunit
MLLAGARAVQVGTATLADPRAPRRVLSELCRLLERENVQSLEEVIGAAHRAPTSSEARPPGS